MTVITHFALFAPFHAKIYSEQKAKQKGLHMDDCYSMFLVGKLLIQLHVLNALRLTLELRFELAGVEPLGVNL